MEHAKKDGTMQTTAKKQSINFTAPLLLTKPIGKAPNPEGVIGELRRGHGPQPLSPSQEQALFAEVYASVHGEALPNKH